MIDDNELHNELHNEQPGADGAMPEHVIPSLPAEDAEPRYDVSGAALGALTPAEAAELYAVAAADPAVAAELAGMEAVAAELARLESAAPMNRGRSAGIRSRLVARAAATHIGRPVSRSVAPDAAQPSVRSTARSVIPAGSGVAAPLRPHTSSPGSQSSSARNVTGAHVIPFEPQSRGFTGRVLGQLALAAVFVVAAFGIYTWRSQSRSGNTGTASGVRDSALVAQVASLRASVAQKDSLIAALTGMHTRVIDLVNYRSADPIARMFWDQKKQTFIMYASNLKHPTAGKTYQVWLIARNNPAPISAGTFMPDSTGAAIMTTRNSMEPGALRRVAVTEEVDGGAVAPTGPILFSGAGR